MKKVTYQQVADALNISRVTVWKAVNDKPGIAPDTKRSILQKAVEMGYPYDVSGGTETEYFIGFGQFFFQNGNCVLGNAGVATGVVYVNQVAISQSSDDYFVQGLETEERV